MRTVIEGSKAAQVVRTLQELGPLTLGALLRELWNRKPLEWQVEPGSGLPSDHKLWAVLSGDNGLVRQKLVVKDPATKKLQATAEATVSPTQVNGTTVRKPDGEPPVKLDTHLARFVVRLFKQPAFVCRREAGPVRVEAAKAYVRAFDFQDWSRLNDAVGRKDFVVFGTTHTRYDLDDAARLLEVCEVVVRENPAPGNGRR